jgi:hypothetical protein
MHRQQNTALDGLIPIMIDFVECMRDFHKKCKYANEFNEPWKTHFMNAVDSSFFALGLIFLLFTLQLFKSIFTLQQLNLSEYGYHSAIAGVVGGAISFIFLIAK